MVGSEESTLESVEVKGRGNRMKVAALLLATLLLSCMVSAKADCPTTASCAEHGMNGNPTGQYKWQGATEYAEFSHPTTNGGTHKWWEKCS